MSTWFNKSKTMMERNWSHAPKKDLNWKRLKKKRRTRKRRKQDLKTSANWWRMSLETKLRKLLSAQELMNHHAFLLPENSDGLPIWRESWRHKHSETHLWPHTWYPRRPWKSTLRTQSSRNWERRLNKIPVIRLSRIWSGFSSRHPSSHLDSP